MHDFVEAFQFIAHNGAVAGQPGAAEPLAPGAGDAQGGRDRRGDLARDRGARSACWLGHVHRGSFVAINLGNIGRALPSLAVLAIGDAFLGLGLTVVELALVILAVPPIITNAYLGVDGVDRDLVDAARGMGMSEARDPHGASSCRWRVPLIFAGIRTAAVFVDQHDDDRLAGGFSGSLGDVIANETSYHFSGVLGAAICVAALALAVEGALTLRAARAHPARPATRAARRARGQRGRAGVA